jgi:pyruvate dehydrogenase E2 component (dihydrolipoamide acetyltransferase)
MDVATEIVMPKLSDSMEEGTILAWLVEPGARVTAGDDLLEVETDKANMTVQAEGSGVLEILAEEGSTLAVGSPVARLTGGDGTAAHRSSELAPEPEEAPSAPVPKQAADAVATPAPGVRGPSGDGMPRATPLARRIGAIHTVDLLSLSGSGVGGRITKSDVLSAAGVEGPPDVAAPTQPQPAPTVEAEASRLSPVEAPKGHAAIQEPSRLQAAIARRMAEAKSTIPHFQVETEVRIDAGIELRARLKEIAGEEPVPSFNDVIVRATALALRGHPKANGSYRDGRFELYRRINIGIAVAADDALVVPTITDADQRSLGEIGRESRRLAERVRSGTVTPPELAGGTFTVSNLGMFGMTAINPVINPPQAAILGVGMMRQLLVRGSDGEIEDASVLTLTLSCDHRILHGAEAAEFLAEIKRLLEQPLLML